MKHDVFVKQLEAVLAEYKAMTARSQHDDLSDLPMNERQALVTKTAAAVNRISGPRSTYSLDIEKVRKAPIHLHVSSVAGVADALLSDLEAGFVDSLIELAHAAVFADFLDMAQYLLDTKYKDASAVIAGSSLEAHLRALCTKNSVDLETTKAGGDKTPKKADTLNSDLAAAGVYEKLEQKSVTAWLDLRNKAAHGQYDTYDTSQVSLLVAGVREFIRRNPA